MCHDVSGGNYKILKLNDSITSRKPGTIEHSRIPHWSSGKGQKSPTKNIVSRNNLVDHHCFPTKYWHEPKDKAIEKIQHFHMELLHATQQRFVTTIFQLMPHLLKNLQARQIVTGFCVVDLRFRLSRYMFDKQSNGFSNTSKSDIRNAPKTSKTTI